MLFDICTFEKYFRSSLEEFFFVRGVPWHQYEKNGGHRNSWRTNPNFEFFLSNVLERRFAVLCSPDFDKLGLHQPSREPWISRASDWVDPSERNRVQTENQYLHRSSMATTTALKNLYKAPKTMRMRFFFLPSQNSTFYPASTPGP